MTQEKDLYQIQYNDNTYRIIELTKAEWIVIGKLMVDEARVAPLKTCILVLTDIRTIVLVPEEPELTEEERLKQENPLGEWDYLSPEERADLAALGIDVGGVK